MIRPLKPLAALLLLFSGPATAQQSHPAPQPVEAMPVAQVLVPALWKLSDADTTIYLFGTIHALPKGLVWLDGPIANALDGSDALVTEIPESSPDEVQALVLREAILPPGQSLHTLLPPDEYKAYEAAMLANGLPALAFDRFKPWYVALALTTLPLLRDGYAVENGVEGALTARMKDLHKPHTGLETMEFQLGIFDKLPLETQRKFLAEAISGQKDFRKQLDQMVQEWGEGDATTLAALLNEDDDDALTREAIFTSRNRNWVNWIKARLAAPGKVFVAVGAGHLAGADSVLDMLGRQGFTVTRVQ